MADFYDYTAGKTFKVLSTGVKPPSSNYSIVECPHCQSRFRAYWWSIAGGGKKCENKACGAMLNSAGLAYPKIAKSKRKKTES